MVLTFIKRQGNRPKVHFARVAAWTQPILLHSLIICSAFNGHAAMAAFVGLDPDCAVASKAKTSPSFNKGYFDQLTKIWASSDGKTGVFFLSGPSGAIVLKFEEEVNVGATVSRRLLKSLNVPSDELVADYQSPKDRTNIEKIFDGMVSASKRAGVVAANRQARFDELASRLQDRFDDNEPPKQLLVTRFLTSFEGAPSLGNALLPGNQGNAMSDEDRKAKVRQFLGAFKAIGSAHNQKFLGYLFAIDVLMGNNDRLVRRGSENWTNIFLAQGPKGAACLVAIDNEAHAPLPNYLAMARYAYDKKPAPGSVLGISDLTRKFLATNNNAQPQLNNTIKGDKQSITGADYLERLMGEYFDPNASVNPDFFGPRVALTGDYLVDSPNAGQTYFRNGPAVNTCEPAGTQDIQGNLPVWLRRHVRVRLATMIGEMMQPVSQWAGWNENAVFSETAANGNVTHPNSAVQYNYVCHSKLETSYEAALGGVGYFSTDIGWASFDQNFQAGFGEAMTDIQDLDEMKTLIDAAVKGMPSLNTTDVHKSGLLARTEFMFRFAKGMDPGIIVQNLLSNMPNETYAKGSTFSAATYKYSSRHGTDIWLPQ